MGFNLSPQQQQLITQVETIRVMHESGALMENVHVDFGNGFHGTAWINPHQIFRRPHLVTRLLNDMLDHAIPPSVIKSVQVVAGPERGGAKIGLLLATMIDARQPLLGERVQFVEVQEDEHEKGKLILPKTCQEIVAGKRVLLVDDVRNTGRTFFQSGQAIRHAGGDLLATVEWYDRLNLKDEYELAGVPNYPLAEHDDGNILMPDSECTLCRLGEPVSKF